MPYSKWHFWCDINDSFFMTHINDSYGIRYLYYTVITSVLRIFLQKWRSQFAIFRTSAFYSSDHELGIDLWSIVVDEVSIIWKVGVWFGIVASSNVGGIAFLSFETQIQPRLTQNWPDNHKNSAESQMIWAQSAKPKYGKLLWFPRT